MNKGNIGLARMGIGLAIAGIGFSILASIIDKINPFGDITYYILAAIGLIYLCVGTYHVILGKRELNTQK